jgi:hypothetical protein
MRDDAWWTDCCGVCSYVGSDYDVDVENDLNFVAGIVFVFDALFYIFAYTIEKFYYRDTTDYAAMTQYRPARSRRKYFWVRRVPDIVKKIDWANQGYGTRMCVCACVCVCVHVVIGHSPSMAASLRTSHTSCRRNIWFLFGSFGYLAAAVLSIWWPEEEMLNTYMNLAGSVLFTFDSMFYLVAWWLNKRDAYGTIWERSLFSTKSYMCAHEMLQRACTDRLWCRLVDYSGWGDWLFLFGSLLYVASAATQYLEGISDSASDALYESTEWINIGAAALFILGEYRVTWCTLMLTGRRRCTGIHGCGVL